MIEVITHGTIRELRFNRPPANALSPEMLATLRTAAQSAPQQGVDGLVISGTDGMFSGGLDVPLLLGLDPQKHFTERKEVTVVEEGQSLEIEDITTSDFEPYDSLAKVYALLGTLSGNATLAEFGFVTRWPELSEEEKLEKYSRYACHELHLFLYEKDPELFEKVVKPYLEHKVHPTFLDDWLLGRDLSGYLEPWAFGRLNAVERILLARRIAGERDSIARHTP